MQLIRNNIKTHWQVKWKKMLLQCNVLLGTFGPDIHMENVVVGIFFLT